MQKEMKNEKLDLAISLLLSDKKKENLESVMEEMKTALLLVPSAVSDEMKKQLELAKQGKKPEAQTKVAISPIFVRNQNGVSYLPVFTAREHIPQEQKYPMLFHLPFAECNRLAMMAKDKVSGIVINPFTHNLVLNVSGASGTANAGSREQKPVSPEQKQVLLRKTMELGMIPQRLFREKGAFVELLSAEREEGLAKLFRQGYQQNAACPYSAGDFNMIVMDMREDFRMIDIEMPTAYCEEGCAKSIYIGWNPKTNAVRYYIITKEGKEKPSLLVELLEGGKVNHLGAAPVNGGEVFHMMELCKDL